MERGRRLIGELEGQKFPQPPDYFIPKTTTVITVYDFMNVPRHQTVNSGISYDGKEIWNIKDTDGITMTDDELMVVF